MNLYGWVTVKDLKTSLLVDRADIYFVELLNCMQHANTVSYLESTFAAHPMGKFADGHAALYNVEYLEHVGKEKR